MQVNDALPDVIKVDNRYLQLLFYNIHNKYYLNFSNSFKTFH